MTKYVEWAQVIYTKLYCYCDCNNEAKYVVNGRSSGLTRTKTTYACAKCIDKVLETQHWSKQLK